MNHNSLSITACTSVDTFAIVHAFFDRVVGCSRHPNKVCDLTHFVSRMKKCRNFHCIVSLGSHFEIHNNNEPFSSISQSQNVGWVKQKPDNNCQTTRIVTMSFVHFFGPPGKCIETGKSYEVWNPSILNLIREFIMWIINCASRRRGLRNTTVCKVNIFSDPMICIIIYFPCILNMTVTIYAPVDMTINKNTPAEL